MRSTPPSLDSLSFPALMESAHHQRKLDRNLVLQVAALQQGLAKYLQSNLLRISNQSLSSQRLNNLVHRVQPSSHHQVLNIKSLAENASPYQV